MDEGRDGLLERFKPLQAYMLGSYPINNIISGIQSILYYYDLKDFLHFGNNNTVFISLTVLYCCGKLHAFEENHSLFINWMSYKCVLCDIAIVTRSFCWGDIQLN